MNVRVQLFAVARQLAGRDAIDVSLSKGATVGQLRRALAESAPALAAVLPHVMFAVDAEYADDASVIPPRASVACIPPVSGG
ncbi:MAG TPA: MoaD/ThiS family protein [Pirellulales bacterium]|jgi:molybdopterin converting factor subunit 1|nr:MoaD/ThiS family protein [Pirellulales bacterium]